MFYAHREEWTEAIQAVADKLQKQEEDRMNCSSSPNLDITEDDEMDTSLSHPKRRVVRAITAVYEIKCLKQPLILQKVLHSTSISLAK